MNTVRMACLWGACLMSLSQAKVVEINGPLIAPWMSGQLCIKYRLGTGREICQLFGAGKRFTFTIPDTVTRIHITRILDKKCPLTHAAKACRNGHGSFTVKGSHVTLTLTQHAGHIRHFHAIHGPAVEPNNAYRSQAYYALPGWWLDETGAVNWKRY